MSILIFSQEGRGYLPVITYFCEVLEDSELTDPGWAVHTIKGEPGHISSQLTLSSFVTLDERLVLEVWTK